MTRPSVLGAAFVATVGFVLLAAAVGGLVTEDGIDEKPEIENPQYLDADLINDRSPGEADVRVETNAEPQTVLVDPGSSEQGTTDRDLSALTNALSENGHEVRIYGGGNSGGLSGGLPASGGSGGDGEELSSLGEELAEADAFVTLETDYSTEQLDDLETFVDEDGRVFVATNPADEFDGPGAAMLGSRLGVSDLPGYVYNLEENDLNYQRIYAEPAGNSSLTDGVDRVVLSTATPVTAESPVAEEFVPTEGTKLSTSRAATDTPVVVRDGGVVMVGDTLFLTPENAQRADNDVFIGNMAEFLVENERNPEEQPPTLPEDRDDSQNSTEAVPVPGRIR